MQINSTAVTCNGGSDGTATVTPSGGTPGYTYAWTPSGGNGATATNLSAGLYSVVVTDNNGCTDTIDVTIMEPAPLALTPFQMNATCAFMCDGSVGVTVGGGTGPYSYQWDTPNMDQTPSVQNLCGGTYNVTVTDANGCVGTAQTGVGAPQNPIADAGLDGSFCEGEGGVQLSGSASGGAGAPYYYSWGCIGGPCGLSCTNCTDPIANPTDTTTFYLIVTDQNGCTSDTDFVQVNVIPKPIVDAGPDTAICAVPAPCVVLQPTIVQGNGPFEYLWIPGTGLNDSTIATPCARPDTTTIYACVVTDLSTGCTSEFTTLDTVSTVLVEVSPEPIADAGPDMIVCSGDTTQLQGTGTGAGPQYEFQWTPAAGLDNPLIANPMASPTLTTTYTLVVFSNGCPSIADSVTVFVTEIPTVDAGQDRDMCAGDSVFLDGSASVVSSVLQDSIESWFWTPGTGLSDSLFEDTWASPLFTTTYELHAVSAYGCENFDDVLVTINPSPIVDAGPNTQFCETTGPWELTGTIDWYGGNQPNDLQNILIEWQPTSHIIGPNDDENVQIDTDSTMWFYFTVTFNNCSHTDSVLITVLNEIIATAEADTSVVCEGDSVLLTATGGIGGANFSWTPTNGVANPNAA
ncbi:MAG: hypothetical protein AAF570_16020, partial [Bacteroidota bacterium]